MVYIQSTHLRTEIWEEPELRNSFQSDQKYPLWKEPATPILQII